MKTTKHSSVDLNTPSYFRTTLPLPSAAGISSSRLTCFNWTGRRIGGGGGYMNLTWDFKVFSPIFGAVGVCSNRGLCSDTCLTTYYLDTVSRLQYLQFHCTVLYCTYRACPVGFEYVFSLTDHKVLFSSGGQVQYCTMLY